MIFKIISEYYDKCWYVRTSSSDKALKLVEDMTKDLGWHLDYPDEGRGFSCEGEIFTQEDTIYESRDL